MTGGSSRQGIRICVPDTMPFISSDLPHDPLGQLKVPLRVDLGHVRLGVTQDGLGGFQPILPTKFRRPAVP